MPTEVQFLPSQRNPHKVNIGKNDCYKSLMLFCIINTKPKENYWYAKSISTPVGNFSNPDFYIILHVYIIIIILIFEISIFQERCWGRFGSPKMWNFPFLMLTSLSHYHPIALCIYRHKTVKCYRTAVQFFIFFLGPGRRKQSCIGRYWSV